MNTTFVIAATAILLLVLLIHLRVKKTERQTIPLKGAMARMKTGDFIAFSRRIDPTTGLKRCLPAVPSYLFRAIDGCEFSHVGVIYKDTQSKEVFLVHCAPFVREADVLVGEPVKGPQMNLLKDVVENYGGYCVWKPILNAVENGKVLEFLRKTYHLPYRWDRDAWKRLLPFKVLAQKERDGIIKMGDIKGYNCTEFVGKCYEYCGVFDRTKRPCKGMYFLSDFTVMNSHTLEGKGFGEFRELVTNGE